WRWDGPIALGRQPVPPRSLLKRPLDTTGIRYLHAHYVACDDAACEARLSARRHGVARATDGSPIDIQTASPTRTTYSDAHKVTGRVRGKPSRARACNCLPDKGMGATGLEPVTSSM